MLCKIGVMLPYYDFIPVPGFKYEVHLNIETSVILTGVAATV